jgi:hypothetical protein
MFSFINPILEKEEIERWTNFVSRVVAEGCLVFGTCLEIVQKANLVD